MCEDSVLKWVAQHLLEASPKYLIRDNDAKNGQHIEAVALSSGIKVLRTPIRAPWANAICERLVGSMHRECLDHIRIVSEAHLRRVLKESMPTLGSSRHPTIWL